MRGPRPDSRMVETEYRYDDRDRKQEIRREPMGGAPDPMMDAAPLPIERGGTRRVDMKADIDQADRRRILRGLMEHELMLKNKRKGKGK